MLQFLAKIFENDVESELVRLVFDLFDHGVVVLRLLHARSLRWPVLLQLLERHLLQKTVGLQSHEECLVREETGAVIDIQDDGTVMIFSSDYNAGQDALHRIEQITAEVEVGKIYQGTVAKLMDFGAFVTILPGKDGLVHISQISDERVENISDKLSEGDSIKVKVLEVDRQGRIRLSMKAVSEESAD